MVTVPTTCPFCACGCGFYLLAPEGELVGVAPSENHPVAAGKLCARGWNAHEAPLWGSRLRQPLIRRNGAMEPTSWADALDHVAGRIRELIDAGRPVGVLGSARATNEENYLAGKLARFGLHTNNIDFCYHAICRPLIAGLEEVTGAHAGSVSLNDIESSETIVLIEGDLARTHPRAAFAVMKAVEKRAHVITIGCARTQMARLSSLHLEAEPGSAGQVIDCLLAGAVRSGLVDPIAVAVHCEGYDALRRDVSDITISDDICRAVEWIAHARRATFLLAPGGGLEDPRKGAAAFATLAALTGHLDRTGSGILLLLDRSNVRGACEMGVAPDRLPGYKPFYDEPSQERLEDLWDIKLPKAPGLEAEKLLPSASGLIVLADDPPSVLPAGRPAMTALEKIECLVVLDAFDTPTARAAHVVLPIASFAETEGTLTSMDGRVQRIRTGTDAPGEARPGWQVLVELCSRFRIGASYGSAADILGEIEQAAPQYAGMKQRILDEPWGGTVVADPDIWKFMLHASRATAPTSDQSPFVLARDGVFDWGRDPLVSFSPTLSRDYRSQRKLFPNGFLQLCKEDADELGVRAGGRVTLTSAHGHAVVPIQVRADLKRGVLLVPYAFRDHIADVLGTGNAAAVKVERI